MNVLCVYFPRLPVQAALRSRPHLAGRELVLVTGAGDDALVTAATNGPSRDGVVPGMRAAEARGLSPRAAFVPGGIAGSLDILEPVAALVRGRITPFVEIGGLDSVFAGVQTRDGDAWSLATQVRALAASWTGLEVRVGIGPSRQAALSAARCARDGVGIDVLASAEAERPIPPWRPESIQAVVTLATPADASRAARRLGALLDARGEGWRTLRLEGPEGTLAAWRTAEPVYTGAQAEELLRSAVPLHSRSVTICITLGGLVPDLRVKPYLGGARRERIIRPAAPQLLPRPLRAAS